jgi:hypothetical protein
MTSGNQGIKVEGRRMVARGAVGVDLVQPGIDP